MTVDRSALTADDLTADPNRLRRKLIEGTEVLRTGGGATLTATECNWLYATLESARDALHDPGAAFPWGQALRSLDEFFGASR